MLSTQHTLLSVVHNTLMTVLQHAASRAQGSPPRPDCTGPHAGHLRNVLQHRAYL